MAAIIRSPTAVLRRTIVLAVAVAAVATAAATVANGVSATTTTAAQNGNGPEWHIKSGTDLLSLSMQLANSNNTFAGTTVILDNDIDMRSVSETFVPIGTSEGSPFNGVFDGQGHVITNLRLTSTRQYVGLFGFSNGTRMRRVVLDRSCSVKSDHIDESLSVGGLLGYCNASLSECAFEDVVSLASLKYEKYHHKYPLLYMGTVVGDCTAAGHDCHAHSCVSSGTITYSGLSGTAHFGGIMARCMGATGRCCVEGAASYTVIHAYGQVGSTMYAGGIVGYGNFRLTLTNCVSMSSISTSVYAGYLSQGAIVGSSSGLSPTDRNSVANCFWDNSTSPNVYFRACGKFEQTDMSSITHFTYPATTLAENVTVDVPGAAPIETDSPAAALNHYASHALTASLEPLPLWTALSFNLRNSKAYGNDGGGIVANDNDSSEEGVPDPVLFPCISPEAFMTLEPPAAASAATNNNSFVGWYIGADLRTNFTLSACKRGVVGDLALYARWAADVVVSFDTGSHGTTYPNYVLTRGSTFALPEKAPEAPGCTFQSWKLLTSGLVTYDNATGTFTVLDTVGVIDIAFVAEWSYNNYSLSFFRDSALISKTTLRYNATIDYPPYGSTACLGFSPHWCLGNATYDPARCDIPRVPPGDSAFYEVLAPDTFVASFFVDGKPFAETTSVYNTAIPYPAKMPSGNTTCVFARWSPSVELAAYNSTHYIMPANNVSFDATWTTTVSSSSLLPQTPSSSSFSSYSGSKRGAGDGSGSGKTFFEKNKTIILAAIIGVSVIAIVAIIVALFYVVVRSQLAPAPKQGNVSKGLLVKMAEFGGDNDDDYRSDYHEAQLFNSSSHSSSSAAVILTDNDGNEESDGSNSGASSYQADKTVVDADTYNEGSTCFGGNGFSSDGGLSDEDASEYARVLQSAATTATLPLTSTKSLDLQGFIYPKSYKRVSIKKALRNAGLEKKYAEMITTACTLKAEHLRDAGRLTDGFTFEDAKAIAMYTYDFGPKNFEMNPYRIINRVLVTRSTMDMQRIKDILFLVMTALRKLHPVRNRILYRGVRSAVNLSKGHYSVGSMVFWTALSSTSPDLNVTKSFLSKANSSTSARTLFIINNGWGYNIQPYSLFPNETEILLEPERVFKVTGVIPSTDITIVNIEMMNTPLPLSEIFGYGIND